MPPSSEVELVLVFQVRNPREKRVRRSPTFSKSCYGSRSRLCSSLFRVGPNQEVSGAPVAQQTRAAAPPRRCAPPLQQTLLLPAMHAQH